MHACLPGLQTESWVAVNVIVGIILTMLRSYRRQASVKGKIPQGFIIGKSTGNGNCLYNSVSILLSGNEFDADLLRLSSVINAVDHFSLYLTKVVSDLHSHTIMI